MGNTRRLSVMLGGAILAAALSSCGGGGSTNPNPVPTPAPTPTPCTQTPLGTAQGPIPALTGGSLTFSTSTTGRIDVTLDWTFPTSPIGMYLIRQGTCDFEQFDACAFLIRSDPSLTKPRRASAQNVAPGNFELLVVNFSETDESLAGQVVLSQGSCPAIGGLLPGPVTGSFRRREGLPLPVRRLP